LFKKKQEKFNKKNQKLKISDIQRYLQYKKKSTIFQKINFSE